MATIDVPTIIYTKLHNRASYRQASDYTVPYYKDVEDGSGKYKAIIIGWASLAGHIVRCAGKHNFS